MLRSEWLSAQTWYPSSIWPHHRYWSLNQILIGWPAALDYWTHLMKKKNTSLVWTKSSDFKWTSLRDFFPVSFMINIEYRDALIPDRLRSIVEFLNVVKCIDYLDMAMARHFPYQYVDKPIGSWLFTGYGRDKGGSVDPRPEFLPEECHNGCTITRLNSVR